jgi:hypothetical protein
MKFARRAEGIKSARLVFKMARENMKTKYQVYVAAALMEYYCSKVSKPITTEAVSSNPTQAGCAQYNIM